VLYPRAECPPETAMLSIAYRVVVLIVGLTLIVLGILGLFLPFLQGLLLIAIGLSVLSLVSERVAGWVDALKSRARAAWRRHRRKKEEAR
jgi:uncharacterized membrane protein YbaN (DUF454 family)